ncbi:MAG: FkbM family methyltransferase [Gammaproteobacteria bacterium]|jgi:FkbM family methyltransferase|nr:hypothetical protein [Chromatiales bacterium]MDP6675580.1 FkbM family methyltransferase [Gammaproteobacteria bacterium]
MTHEAVQANVLRALIEMEPAALCSLSFSILEIGAAPLEGAIEPFYQLTDIFPESRIVSLEVDESLCIDLNRKAKDGHQFYPAALGRTEETRQFFQTTDPICSSLYRPNEELLARYYNMESVVLERVTSIDTVSLDHFVAKKMIDDVDFIKIDIQGAELEVFQGGMSTLRSVPVIVSEVEFVPQYINQPLFGDVCSFLMAQGFMFHKFLGMAGRALRPVLMHNDRNSASQHIWTDAMFIKDILRLSELPVEKLLKMGILSYLYNSPDVAYSCFHAADEKGQTDIGLKFLQTGRNIGAKKPARRRWLPRFRH